MILIRHVAVILVLVLASSQVFLVNGQKSLGTKKKASEVTPAEKEEWDYLKKRFAEYGPHLPGLTWSLIHNYESKSEVDKALKVFQAIAVTLSNDQPTTIRKFKGPHGLNQRLSNLMNSRDSTVSGFAAMMLAFIGDIEYASQIAALLKREGIGKDGFENTIRGQAASALGVLGARQYIPQIASLLRSSNHYDRQGAVSALARLKAIEYADQIAGLLTATDPDNFDFDDDSPFDALFELGVAANYKKEIARALQISPFGERAATAMYALARLQAREHTPDIAALLTHHSNKGEAAKALALMGAKQHTNEILPLLQDSNSFDREDGALALGILDAREHAEAVAKLLNDKEWGVRNAAARALVLMEKQEYATDVLRVLKEQKQGPYFDSEDLNPLVNDKALELDRRFMTLWSEMKRKQSSP